MPVRPVFVCEFCGARPDPETFYWLRRQMLDLRFGEYVDADPGQLADLARARHLRLAPATPAATTAGELKADLRETYGTIGRHPWAKGPHPWAGRRGTDRARRLARSLGSTFGAPG